MGKTTLRQLARSHAEGALHTEAYRRARAEYIEAVLTAADGHGPLTQANYTSPPTVTGEETMTAARVREYEQTRIVSNTAASQPAHMQTQPIQLSDRSQPPLTLIAGAVAVLLILGAGLFLLSGGEADEGVATAGVAPRTTQPHSMQPLPDNSGNAALGQLQGFLEAPQWEQHALDDFVARWQSLPAADRETALQTTLARKLGDILYRQLLEERALDGLNTTANGATSGQEKIVNFARDIGLDDRRLAPPAHHPDGMNDAG